MVETITPVVHGGRRERWAIVLSMHVAGAVAAAAAFGAALGQIGALLGAPWGAAGIGVVASLALLYLARETFGIAVPVPQLRRQVPDWWRTFFGPGSAAFLYGVGLGIGFLTFLAHGTLVVVSAAAVVSGEPAVGAAFVAPFGVARGLSAAVAVRARTNEDGAALVGRLAAAASWRLWPISHATALAGILVASAAIVASAEAPGRVGRLAAAVLAVAFAGAATAKVVARRRWRRALAAYRVPARLERVAFVGVPAAEAGVAALALLGLASTAGAASVVVLAVFSAAIVVARIRVGRRLDCGCFGSSVRRDWRLLLGRNGALAMAGIVAWREGPDAWLGGSLSPPSGGDVLPAALVATGIALATWVVVRAAATARRASGR